MRTWRKARGLRAGRLRECEGPFLGRRDRPRTDKFFRPHYPSSCKHAGTWQRWPTTLSVGLPTLSSTSCQLWARYSRGPRLPSSESGAALCVAGISKMAEMARDPLRGSSDPFLHALPAMDPIQQGPTSVVERIRSRAVRSEDQRDDRRGPRPGCIVPSCLDAFHLPQHGVVPFLAGVAVDVGSIHGELATVHVAEVLDMGPDGLFPA